MAVVLLELFEKILQFAGTQVEEMGVVELYYIEVLHLRKGVENIIKITERAHGSGTAHQRDVGGGMHMAAAVADHHSLVAQAAQSRGQTRVHVRIIACEKYLHVANITKKVR